MSIQLFLNVKDAVTLRTISCLQKSVRQSPKSARQKVKSLLLSSPRTEKMLRISDFTKGLHQASKSKRIPDTEEQRTSPNSFYEADVPSNIRLKEEK